MSEGAWQEREQDLDAELNRSALWAVTYGDLMSYLAIFFLILYASVTTRSVSLQMSLRGVEEEFGKDGGVVRELFSHYGVQRIAKLEIGEDKMRILFLEPVLFESGSARLKESAMPHLKTLARALATLPNLIQVEGHTDNVPLGPSLPFASNWELSAARAFAVLRAMEAGGIPAARLSAIGYGEHRPIKPNEAEAGRSANRRIEINLMRRSG